MQYFFQFYATATKHGYEVPIRDLPNQSKRNGEPQIRVYTKKRWMEEDSMKETKKNAEAEEETVKVWHPRGSGIIVSRCGSSKQYEMAQATSHWELKSELWDLTTMNTKYRENEKIFGDGQQSGKLNNLIFFFPNFVFFKSQYKDYEP